jgi:hypothetical protein
MEPLHKFLEFTITFEIFVHLNLRFVQYSILYHDI